MEEAVKEENNSKLKNIFSKFRRPGKNSGIVEKRKKLWKKKKIQS